MITTLDDLFLHTLKDIYYAEKQIKKALPKMVSKAASKDLSQALDAHLDETVQQIERLEHVFELLGKPARGVKCEAIEGILEEANEQLAEIKDEMVRDAAIISCAQAVEHYEICRYETLIGWAKILGHKNAVKPLQEILAQETAASGKLSKLAASSVDQDAAKAAETGAPSPAPAKKPAMKKAS